jgi:L-amino acid N-acyltransferase YncA
MSVSIRVANSGDAAAIAAIYAPFVMNSTVTFELEPPDAAEIAQRIALVLEHGLPYLIAEIDGEVVGYAYATPFRPRLGYRFTVEDSVYVREGHAGQGIGRMLLRELIERCRAAGCRQMLAVVGGANAASMALHGGVGFVHAGVLKDIGFKLGEFRDVTMMQLAL